MHIAGENTVISNAWELLVFFKHITGENMVNSYTRVHLVVFYAYYW